jgi:hypothetical protein
MRKTVLIAGISLAAVLLSANGLTFAQNSAQTTACFRKFDEYGNLRACDHGARLDNYAIALQNEPGTYGYIVVYAPESASKPILNRITEYLVDIRGIPAKRLKPLYAGFNMELTEPLVQLSILPKDMDFQLHKFDVDLEAVKGMLVEYQSWDDVEIEPSIIEEDFGNGPSVGNVRYAAVNEILKAQKHSVAHVVAFNGSNAVSGAWRRVAEATVADLKDFGLASDRVKIGYGGQVKDPASEPVPAKAAQIGEFSDYDLGKPKNELIVFNRLLTTMRENRDLRACLIVRMDVSDPDEEPVMEEPAEPTEAPEPEPADLLKLVDKWKNELIAKNKIGADRVVILYSKAEPGYGSSLDIWVVPPGQPLPDPDAKPEDEKPSDVIKDAQRRP